MKKKLTLDVEALAVESFVTAPGEKEARGTVRGHAACTCYDSCLCPTAYYECGTGPHTIHSCDYTYNQSCGFDTNDGCRTYDPYDCLEVGTEP